MSPYCAEETTVLGGPKDRSPEGVSAFDVLAPAQGTHTVTFTYGTPSADGFYADVSSNEPGAETEMTLTVEYDGGEIRYVDSEAVYPEARGAQATIDIAIECQPRLEVDAILHVQTADGGLDESWEVVLTRRFGEFLPAESSETTISVELEDLDGLMGSMRVVSFDPAGPDETSYAFEAWFSDDGVGGEFTATGTYFMGDAVMGALFEIGRWGTQRPGW